MKLFKYFIEFILIIIFFLICKILGVKKSSNFACTIFKKIGPIIRSNSKTINHIKIAFPKIKENDLFLTNFWCF